MKFLKLSIGLIALLAISVSCKYLNKPDKLIDNTSDTLLTSVFEDIVEAIDSTAIETIVQETEPIEEPVEMEEPTNGYGNNRFYMVVGSFLSEPLAQKYAKKMQDMGYQPQVIYSSSLGFYRVSAKSYDQFKVAIDDISNFRNNVTPRAWVHVKK